MDHLNLLFAILATIYPLPNYTSTAQDLTAVMDGARLPTERSFVASMYDGDDTIYLFGGMTGSGPNPNSVKYSISQHRIVETAGQLPISTYGGSITTNKLGSIFYVTGGGGWPADDDIWQYFPQTETFTNVSKLPVLNDFSTNIVKPDDDTALILGGKLYSKTIQRLNLNTLESEIIAEHPKDLFGTRLSGVLLREENVVYLFDGLPGLENVTKWDLSTNQFEFLPNYFPPMSGHSQAVWDGRFAYLIGGFGSDTDDTVPYDSILQFDPETGDVNFIKVINYPGFDGAAYGQSSAVYVAKLNRIYMFGGYTDDGRVGFRDEIWYISLDPLGLPTTTTATTTTEANTPIPTLNPDVFNCVGLGESTHPYPGDCSKYVLCRGDHAYGFDCQEPLLFHPEELECMWPDLVECQ